MRKPEPVSVPTESRPTEDAVKFKAFNKWRDQQIEEFGARSQAIDYRQAFYAGYESAASSSLLPVGRPCSACQGNHFDHTFVHFSLSNDLGGFCWEEDHYPNEGDILVSSNISEVTCPKCREYCQTLNDLKKSEGFSEDDIRRDDLPRDTFELIHELAYDHEGRDRWQYRTRAQQILKSNGLPVGRQLEPEKVCKECGTEVEAMRCNYVINDYGFSPDLCHLAFKHEGDHKWCQRCLRRFAGRCLECGVFPDMHLKTCPLAGLPVGETRQQIDKAFEGMATDEVYQRESARVRGESTRWTDQDLYDAYLRGCEDDCLPEPLDKGTFLASWEDTEDVQ